jgi:glyceraldehyde-3-phosphate dehydrogenase type I
MRIAINGFGRIGRQVFRQAWAERDIEIAHVNDLGDAATMAHLLAYDTSYGPWNHEVRGEGEVLAVDGREIPVSAEKNPGDLPWQARDVDVVLESTGVFRTRDDAARHLAAGARKVLVSAPGKSPLDGDFVIGVNDDAYDHEHHDVISIGSCTTNCLAPVARVLHEEFGIEHGVINTIHGYTSTQSLQDGPHKDLRRARAAAENIIPTTTGAARAIGTIMPELDGKLDGLAVRVPVPTGSLLDLTCRVGKRVDAEMVNAAFRTWAEQRLEGVLLVQDAPIVSSDVVGDTHSAVVSPQDTLVMGDGDLVKVLAWYDNEWGFSRRCLDMMQRMVS